jgi:hypothetical protein
MVGVHTSMLLPQRRRTPALGQDGCHFLEDGHWIAECRVNSDTAEQAFRLAESLLV